MTILPGVRPVASCPDCDSSLDDVPQGAACPGAEDTVAQSRSPLSRRPSPL